MARIRLTFMSTTLAFSRILRVSSCFLTPPRAFHSRVFATLEPTRWAPNCQHVLLGHGAPTILGLFHARAARGAARRQVSRHSRLFLRTCGQRGVDSNNIRLSLGAADPHYTYSQCGSTRASCSGLSRSHAITTAASVCAPGLWIDASTNAWLGGCNLWGDSWFHYSTNFLVNRLLRSIRCGQVGV
jgi:hypothetical protein